MEGLGLAVGETPAPAPPVEKKPVSGTGKTFAQAIIDEQAAAAVAPPDPAPPATPPAPAAATPAAPATPPAPEPPPAPVAVEKRPGVAQIVEQTVKKTLESLNPPKPTETPAAPAVDPFEAQLTEAEKDELQLARWAAAKYPEHKGLADKTLDFFKKLHAKIETDLKADPDRDFDSDPEFRKWKQQNAPAISHAEKRKLERAHIVDSAREEIVREQSGQLEEIRRQQRALELKPVIEREVTAHASKIETQLADDPIAASVVTRAKEVGWDQTLQEDRVFAPVVKNLQDQSVQLATEFKLLMSGVKAGDPNNAAHKWLWNFMQMQYQHYATNDQARVRDGKTFLPRSEYFEAVKKDPNAAHRHFTIGEAEFLDLLASNTQQNIKNTVKAEEERLVASGFERKPRTPAAAQIPKSENTPPVAPPAQAQTSAPATTHVSPRAVVSAAPGAAQTTRPAAANQDAVDLIATLGLKVPA